MKKILVVEDDSFLQRLISKKLSDQEYAVSIAGGGEEAFKMMEKEIRSYPIFFFIIFFIILAFQS